MAEREPVAGRPVSDPEVQSIAPDVYAEVPLEGALEGHQVSISGLKSRPELNGQYGIVVSFSEAHGRFHVQLENGETLALKPSCLKRVVYRHDPGELWSS